MSEVPNDPPRPSTRTRTRPDNVARQPAGRRCPISSMPSIPPLWPDRPRASSSLHDAPESDRSASLEVDDLVVIVEDLELEFRLRRRGRRRPIRVDLGKVTGLTQARECRAPGSATARGTRPGIAAGRRWPTPGRPHPSSVTGGGGHRRPRLPFRSVRRRRRAPDTAPTATGMSSGPR